MAQVFPLHLIKYNLSPSCTQLNGEGCYYSLQIAMFDDVAGYIYVTCSITLAMFNLATLCVCVCVCGSVVQPPRGDPWILGYDLANATTWVSWTGVPICSMFIIR